MKLVTSAQIREIDRQAIEDYGISGFKLMSSAAEHVAKAAMEYIPANGYVAVFCGTGNNGGDGLCVAAFLIEKGISVRTIMIGDPDNLTPDAGAMYEKLKSCSGSIDRFSPSIDLVEYVNTCAVVIDAVFGVGLNSDLQSEALSAVSIINSSRAKVISVDIPSGVHADTGAVLGDAVKADITITFTLAKPGHFIEPGCIYCGELKVCDIGIPANITSAIVSHIYAAMPKDIHIPRRRPNTHKGDYGRALIIAGSVGYTGAPALCARAATKMGAGLVSLGVPKSIFDIMAIKLDEEMPFPLPDNKEGQLIANATSEVLRRVKKSDVCLIGPGLGRSNDISELVQTILRLSETPIVLDADGLNAIIGNIEILNQASCPLILTPHYGEFERLCGKNPSESAFSGDEKNINAIEYVVNTGNSNETDWDFDPDWYSEAFENDPYNDHSLENTYYNYISGVSAQNINESGATQPKRVKAAPMNRIRTACDFASKYGCILVLKGHRTITALPNGIAYVNTTGGPAMAKGGSGDVLAGMIAAFIAQKIPTVHAVAAAVYIHGLSGDLCAMEYSDYCVTASDIISMLPKAMKEIELI